MVLIEVLVPGTDSANELGPVDAVLAIGWLLFFARWFLRGGWITIDDATQEIQWRRPVPRTRVASVWAFDEVTRATALRRANGELVSLAFGDRSVVVKVPRGEAVGLAASLEPSR